MGQLSTKIQTASKAALEIQDQASLLMLDVIHDVDPNTMLARLSAIAQYAQRAMRTIETEGLNA